MKLFPLPLACLAVATLAITGCSRSEKDASADSDPVTIGAIPKSTGGEFWETVETGARRAASELGVELKWEGTLTETEIAEQNKIIENMINLGVDGIALAPLNRQAQRKAVETSVNAGIPVVIFDSAVDGNAYSSFVATNNIKGGAIAGEHMAKVLEPGAKVMVMRYVQGTGSTEERAAGFIEAAKAGGLVIVADPYPETGTLEGSKNVAANTLEGMVRNGRLELDGLFAANLYSTLGVASALDDLRKSGIEVDVKFIGFDSSKKLVEELQQGAIQGLVVQDPEKMGYLAIKTMYQVIQGETVPPTIDTGVELITAERLSQEPAMRKLVGLPE